MAIGSIGGGFGLGFGSDYTGGADFSSAFKSPIGGDVPKPASGGGGFGFGQGLAAVSGGLQLAQGIQSGDAMGMAQGALGLASLIPGVGQVAAIAGIGLSVLDAVLPSEDEVKAGEEARQRVFANYAREVRNNFKREQFLARLETVDTQLDNNWAAAWKDWVNIQRNTNTTLEVAAFKQADMLRRVTEIAGAHAAREVYGRSAARGAAVSSFGRYGVATAQLTKQKKAVVGKAVEDMKATNLSLKAANDRAMASIGPPPIMEMGFDAPYQDVSPTGLATGLKIANASMPYIEKGWEMTAPGGRFFGIKKPVPTST